MNFSVAINEAGTPDVLTRIETTPPTPRRGEVIVRNRAVAVNFIDTVIRRGAMPPGMMPPLPHVPGVEGAGIVEAVGAGVGGVAIGDRVVWMGALGSGGYGTHSRVAETGVVRLPLGVGFEAAAALPVNALTAWHMLVNLGSAAAGKTVLIHAAAGGVGTMALQIAKHLGMTAIAAVSAEKSEYALAQGAEHAIDYRRDDCVSRTLEITQGRGVDLSLNPVSGETLKADLNALAPFGTAILFGFLAGPPVGSFATDLAAHFQKSVAVRVSDVYTHFTQNPAAFAADFHTVAGMLAQGTLRPHIHATLPLERAAEAHRILESREVRGKIVLSVP